MTAEECGRSAQVRPTCWGCGAEAPRHSHLGVFGWVSRKTKCCTGGKRETELYCDRCAAEWGWPPETLYSSDEVPEAVGIDTGKPVHPTVPPGFVACGGGRRRGT